MPERPASEPRHRPAAKMAHASAHVSPCATRAQHGARRVAADAAGSGAGGLPPRGHSRPHRVAPCSPPALRTRCAAPLLRTLSTPCGVHGAARRVSGGISRRRTAASATSESAAPSAADVKQGRILLGVVGASYGASARGGTQGRWQGGAAEWASCALLSKPASAACRHPLTPHSTRVQALLRLPCASSSCCPARRCVSSLGLHFPRPATTLSVLP